MECTYFQRYEEKIVTEALEEGINKNNIGIAKDLKKESDWTNEKIAEITRLDPKTVEQL